MSNLQFQFVGPTGNYYVNLLNASGEVYVPVSGLFKNYLLNEQSQYAISLTGTLRNGHYYNVIDFSGASGTYDVDYIRKFSSNYDRVNDYIFICDTFYWDGSKEIDLGLLNSQNSRFTFDGSRVNASTTGFNPSVDKVTLATGLHPNVTIPFVNTVNNNVNINSNSDILSIKSTTDQFTFNNGNLYVQTTGFTNEAISGLLNSPVEAGYTVAQVFKLIGAALGGYRAGGGTSTVTFKGLDNSTTRITMQVDSNGNSSSNPTLNL